MAAPGFHYKGNKTLTMDTLADGHPMQPSREILDGSWFRDQEDIREPLRAKWDRYYNHVMSHIPYGADKLCLNVPDDDVMGVESTLNLKTQMSIPRTPNIPRLDKVMKLWKLADLNHIFRQAVCLPVLLKMKFL